MTYRKLNGQDVHGSIDSFKKMEDTKMKRNHNNMHNILLLLLVAIFLGPDYTIEYTAVL